MTTPVAVHVPAITKEFVEERVDALLVSMSRGTAPSSRPYAFRCSSLPTCGIRSLTGADKGQESYQSEFYTSIGTAVHEAAQKWITLSNLKTRVFARWKCSHCKDIAGPGFMPDSCPGCGSVDPAFTYEEVLVEYRGLSGHVDLIYEIAPGQFVVCDFKTTNLSKARMRGDWQNKYPASPSSLVQIGAYCTILRILFKINIVAWCLIYVDRGAVITSAKDYHKVTRPWTRAKHKAMHRRLANASANHHRFVELKKAIEGSDGYNPVAVDLLKDLIRYRPCVDEESYQDWMAYKFHKFSTTERVCKYKALCMKGSRPIYEKVLQEISA